MTSQRNPITGDKIQTKVTTQEYRDGWDAIFGKEKETHECLSQKGGCFCDKTTCKCTKETNNDREIQESK